jgi:hypothetical protein
MTFDELVASLRQIDGQRDKGKHPTELPLQIEAVPARVPVDRDGYRAGCIVMRD